MQTYSYPSPLRLLTLITFSVFTIETLVMLLFPHLPFLPAWLKAVVDAALLVALLFPLLYCLAFRPLTRQIAERLRAEENIEHLDRVLRAIRNVNQLIAREKDRDRLLQGTCDHLVETRCYDIAWLALCRRRLPTPTEKAPEGAETIVSAGLGAEFAPLVEKLRRGEWPECGRRALEQTGVFIADLPSPICADCPLDGSHDAGQRRMSVRLEYGSQIYGVLTVSTLAGMAASLEEQALLTEIAGDLAFALHAMELEQAHWQAEAALRESEEKLSALFSSMSEIVALHELVFDKEGESVDYRIVDCNEAFEKVLGIAREDAVGKLATEVYEGNEPPYFEEYCRVAMTGKPHTFETYYPPMDKHFLISVASPGKNQFATVMTDVTARKQAEEVLKRRAAQLALLNDIGGQIATELDLDRLLERITRLVQESFGYHHVALFIREGEREVVMQSLAGDFAHLFPDDHRLELEQGLVGWVGRYGETLLANDVDAETRYVNLYPQAMHTRSELSVPIRLGDAILGVLDVQSPQPDAFDENDVLAIETLAGQIAIAIENARLYESVRRELAERKRRNAEIRRRNRELSTLHETALDLSAQRSLPDLLPAIMDRAVALLQAGAGAVYLYRPDSDDLELAFAHEPDVELVGAVLRRGEGLAGKVLDSGEALVVDDYGRWAGRSAQYEDSGFAACVAAPIAWGDRLLGVLNLRDDVPRTFSPDDVALLERLASLAAVALENNHLLNAERQQRELAEGQAAELRASERYLALLNAITLAALQTSDLQSMLPFLVDRLSDLFDADGCCLTLWDEEEQRMLPMASSGSLREMSAALHAQPGETTLTESALRAGRPLVVEDVFDAPYLSPRIAALFPARSLLALPLIAGDWKLGAMLVAFDQAHHFSPDEIARGEQAAGQVALAIAKARLLETEREQRQIAESLREASLALGSTLDRDQVLDELLVQIGAVIPYDSANVTEVEDGVGRVTHQRGRERASTPQATAMLRLPVAETPNLRRMAATRRPHVVPDTQADPDWIHFEQTRWVRSWAGAPIVVRDEVVAFFSVDSATAGLYTAEQADLLAAFAAHASVAVENVQLYEDLQQRMAELRRTQAQLVQSAKLAAIGELAAGVAHELNNPLTSVLGFAELVARAPSLDEVHREDLQVIVAEAHRARDIVRNLLSFARQTKPHREQADVNQVLQQTLTLIRSHLEKSGITIEERYDAELGRLWLDSGQIKQVFLNLITNAAQAMPQGGRLCLRTARLGNGVAVSVTDTGPGIPVEDRERVFEPFFTTKPSGTGLGLSVSLGIVQEHGGRITVESQMGEGSTFTVWLPAGIGTEEDEHGG